MTMSKAKRLGAAAAIAAAMATGFEGVRQYAYFDPPGILTVCMGSTKNVIKGKKYSLAECEARLTEDMWEAITTVERCVPGLPENKLAAFADAVYNIGPKVVCDTKRSTAARLLKAGKWDEACNQLVRWDKARVAGVMVALPGLTKRREAERRLCLNE